MQVDSSALLSIFSKIAEIIVTANHIENNNYFWNQVNFGIII